LYQFQKLITYDYDLKLYQNQYQFIFIFIKHFVLNNVFYNKGVLLNILEPIIELNLSNIVKVKILNILIKIKVIF